VKLANGLDLFYFTMHDAWSREFLGITSVLAIEGNLYLAQSTVLRGKTAGSCSEREFFDILGTIRPYAAQAAPSQTSPTPTAEAAPVPLLR
jgi:hypothetical protein